jgi:hypothetical protein
MQTALALQLVKVTAIEPAEVSVLVAIFQKHF